MFKRSFLVLIMLLILVSAPLKQAVPAPKPAAVPAQPASKNEWNKTIAVAKQEGGVVIFATVVKTTQNDLSNAFVKEFGIQPEFRVMTAKEYMTRLFTERRAGI